MRRNWLRSFESLSCSFFLNNIQCVKKTSIRTNREEIRCHRGIHASFV